MTGKMRAVCVVVSVLASATLISTVAAEPTDVLGPEAAQLESRSEALRRGAAELKKLNSIGIKTLTQMAQADAAKAEYKFVTTKDTAITRNQP